MPFCFIPHTSVSLSSLLSSSICLCLFFIILPSNHLSFLSYYMSLPFHSHFLSVSSTLFLLVRGSRLQHSRLISQENVNPIVSRGGGDTCSGEEWVIQWRGKKQREGENPKVQFAAPLLSEASRARSQLQIQKVPMSSAQPQSESSLFVGWCASVCIHACVIILQSCDSVNSRKWCDRTGSHYQ